MGTVGLRSQEVGSSKRSIFPTPPLASCDVAVRLVDADLGKKKNKFPIRNHSDASTRAFLGELLLRPLSPLPKAVCLVSRLRDFGDIHMSPPFSHPHLDTVFYLRLFYPRPPMVWAGISIATRLSRRGYPIPKLVSHSDALR